VSGPSSANVIRADATARVATAAHSLAAASELLASNGDTSAATLCDYVSGWVNRLILEIIDPDSAEDEVRPAPN